MRPNLRLAVLCVLAFFTAPLFAAPAMKEWTLLVFINADNDLDQFGVADQLEMARVGSNGHLNIVTLIDRARKPAALNFIEKDRIIQLKDMGEPDMGDYRVLTAFVREMSAAYPARHYMLVVWNHGSGWKKQPADGLKGISYDYQSGNHITTEQLALAMADIREILGRRLDVLAFDACLMQMAEVLWAVRESCDFVVGSEQTVPGDGYPYDDVLGGFRPGMSPAEVCSLVVRAFDSSYDGGSQGSSSSTLSAVKCERLGALKTAVDNFSRAMIAKDFGPPMKEALGLTTQFQVPQYVDLGHFVHLAAMRIDDAAVKSAADALEKALLAAVTANRAHGDMAESRGLSIFFPALHLGFPEKYAKLDWAKDSLWDEMLADFYLKTSSESVLEALRHGDISVLAEVVRHSRPEDREVSRRIATKVNFAAFVEEGIDTAIRAPVSRLLGELIAR